MRRVKMSDFSGVFTALATPFVDGKLDFESMKRLVRHQLDGGVQGLVVNGTTGESPTLSQSEVKELFTFVRAEVDGQVPIVVGTGSNSTRATQDYTRLAAQWGADGALVVTPYYNKPPQSGLVQHFKAVAEACEIPLILYNVPGRTITSIEKESLLELSQHPNIVGVKEASGDLAFGQILMSSLAKDFLVVSGDDPTCIDLCLNGAQGVISVISNLIPGPLSQMISGARSGNTQCREDYRSFENLQEALYCESNPIPVKAGLEMMGLFKSPELRLPLVEMSAEARPAMEGALRELNLL